MLNKRIGGNLKRNEIARLPKKTLVSLLEVCLRDIHTIDGLWFLAVEKVLGQGYIDQEREGQ